MSSEDEGIGSGVSGSATSILIVGGSANCLIRWDLLSGNRCALEKNVLLPRGGLQICRCEVQWERCSGASRSTNRYRVQRGVLIMHPAQIFSHPIGFYG